MGGWGGVGSYALLSSSPSLIWLQLGFGLAGAVTIYLNKLGLSWAKLRSACASIKLYFKINKGRRQRLIPFLCRNSSYRISTHLVEEYLFNAYSCWVRLVEIVLTLGQRSSEKLSRRRHFVSSAEKTFLTNRQTFKNFYK